MIDKKPMELVVAQAGGVAGIVPVTLESSSPPVEAAQPLAGGADPEDAGRVFNDTDYPGSGSQAGSEGSVDPGPSVHSNESVVVADPEHSFAIQIDGIDKIHVKTVEVSRFMTEVFKKRRSRVEMVGLFRMQTCPDVAFAILVKADHFIFSRASEISGFASVTHEAP